MRMSVRDIRRALATAFAVALLIAPMGALGQEASEGSGGQDDESKALDSTATQWSFQFAWQGMTYHEDMLSDGSTRPAGSNDYLQLRIVAPLAFDKVTILPRGMALGVTWSLPQERHTYSKEYFEDTICKAMGGRASLLALCTPESAELLREAGFELAATRDEHLCCGSAGTYSILQPERSERLRQRKLEALGGDHPELIATANVGCQLHLQGGSDVPVRHWIELLDLE